MRKGSITVFLALVLTLLFSFVLTTLEAARIRGATAYAAMVTDLAGESFLASYYYPMFENYRLFGVNAGNGEGFFSKEILKKNIQKDMEYGMEEQSGGLLRFRNTEVKIEEHQTLLSKEEEELFEQIRKQVVLDGTSLALSELFSEEMLKEAGAAGKIYHRQEEALEVTATVAKEVLQLMEQVDGIKMSNTGIDFDYNGSLQSTDAFVKQIVPMELRPLRESYGNEEVFGAVADKLTRIDNAAARVLNYLTEIGEVNRKMEETLGKIAEYQSALISLSQQLEALELQEESEEGVQEEIRQALERIRLALEQQKALLEEYEKLKQFLMDAASEEYYGIVQKVNAVIEVLCQSLSTVETLEKKQETAKTVVGSYEMFLEEAEKSLSKEVCDVFVKELERMKVYAGLGEKGISVGTIRQSLSVNYGILSSFVFDGFSEESLGTVAGEMNTVIRKMKEYTTRGLWFTYGDIVVAENTWENVMGALGTLLGTGVLSLVGIPKEKVSDGKVSGKDLPSAGIAGNYIFEELMNCLEEVTGLLQNGAGEVLQTAGKAALDEMVLELYCRMYFYSFGEESPYTKLKYEREYIIFGAEKDKSNLLTAVLHLASVRTLFCMVMILKQPERMAKLESLGAGVVGFTGMPVLAAVVKYGGLLLWSVEEALIEVSALLQGKRIAVVGTGMVTFSELFSISSKMIARKSGQLLSGTGAEYSDYLVLFSLTKGTRDKAYRVLDLIQENIRWRYNDSFRIRNMVTELVFTTQTETKKLFDTGIFPEEAYRVICREARAY